MLPGHGQGAWLAQNMQFVGVLHVPLDLFRAGIPGATTIVSDPLLLSPETIMRGEVVVRLSAVPDGTAVVRELVCTMVVRGWL